MTQVVVAPPLIQGEKMYRECLNAVLRYSDTVNPTKANLLNYLSREFNMASGALGTRGIPFLCALDLIQKESKVPEVKYGLAPAGRRYLEHQIPDLLFIQFLKTVEAVP